MAKKLFHFTPPGRRWRPDQTPPVAEIELDDLPQAVQDITSTGVTQTDIDNSIAAIVPGDLLDTTRAGILFSAADDAAATTLLGGSPFAGAQYYNTTLNMIRFYNGTIWDTVGVGVPTPPSIGEVKTVTGDFATLDLAVQHYYYLFLQDRVNIIDVDAGTYALADTFADVHGDLLIRGDTRPIVGVGFVHNSDPDTSGYANTGSGLITLSTSGLVLTVTRAGGNPDFGAAGAVNGDELIISDNNGSWVKRTVDSVSGNQIMATSNFSTMNANGAGFAIVPNRKISSALSILNQNGRIKFQGFEFEQNVTVGGELTPKGNLELENCTLDLSRALTANRGGVIYSPGALSFYRAITTINAFGWAYLIGTTFLAPAQNIVQDGGQIYANEVVSTFGAPPWNVRRRGILISVGLENWMPSHGIYLEDGGRAYLHTPIIKRKSGSRSGNGIYCFKHGRVETVSPSIEEMNQGVVCNSASKVLVNNGSGIINNNAKYNQTDGVFDSTGALISEN